MDCCKAERLYSYCLYIRLTNTIAERLRRWLKSVIFTDDVRFVDSKPRLVTFLLIQLAFVWITQIELPNCRIFVRTCDRNFTEDIRYIQLYNIWTLLLNK